VISFSTEKLVALDSQGRPSFKILQNVSLKNNPIYYYASDLLNRKGELLVTLPLSERRKALETLLPGRPNPLRLSPLLEAPAGQVLATVRNLGLGRNRGQRIDSLYESGERSGARVNQASREYGGRAVIGDHIPGARGFDALLVGVYEKRELILVAKVKNGFVPRILDEVFPALKALQTVQCPMPQHRWTLSPPWRMEVLE
jgi:bifunctional non-homologous end joining protein LigD